MPLRPFAKLQSPGMMSTSSPSSFPAVYHPTISEYYPLVIRLKDYLKCLINLQDWSEVFGISADASKDAEVHEQYLELIGGVLLSFGNPQATMIEDSWNSGGERRIGQQVQNQVDVSVSPRRTWYVLNRRIGSLSAMS